MSTNPPSIARPPPPVTNRAWRAADRAPAFSSFVPISRNEVIEVSSQNMKSRNRLSLHTRPNIDPANSSSTAAVRGTSGPSWKYDAAYQNTHSPTPPTSSTRIIENQSNRRSMVRPRPATHSWDSVKGPPSERRAAAQIAQPSVHSGARAAT